MSEASNASDTSVNVRLGLWTNWRHGAIRGSTITLNARDGDLLIAFIALFVSITGSLLWRIICLALHRILSTSISSDGLYHQRQAVLRNSSSSASGVWDLLTLGWYWRAKSNRAYRRVLPLCTLAACIASTFAVCGIFSSRISSLTGNEVLISSSSCGVYYNIHTPNSTELWGIEKPYEAALVLKSDSYARECYNTASQKPECSTYVRKYLPHNVTTEAECPFGREVCESETPAIAIDTGFLIAMTISESIQRLRTVIYIGGFIPAP